MIPALRKLAQCTLVALLLVFPVREFSAADALPQVNTIPRFALIIGNGKYRAYRSRMRRTMRKRWRIT
jgi:hypothetical protein